MRSVSFILLLFVVGLFVGVTSGCSESADVVNPKVEGPPDPTIKRATRSVGGAGAAGGGEVTIP
jgi:hypothetical protein